MQSRLLFIAMALALGAVLPMQAAINSRLAKTAGNPVMAAFVSFAVGTIALMIFLIIAGQFQFRFVSSQSSWWIWTGGLLGTFFVAGIVDPSSQTWCSFIIQSGSRRSNVRSDFI